MVRRKITAIIDGYATTTDNSTHVPLATFDTSTGAPGGAALDNCAIYIEARVAGFNTTGNTAGSKSIAGLFKVVSGTMSQVPSTDVVAPIIDDMTGTPTIDFSTSGTVITFFVEGGASETTEWFGTMNLTIYQPA